MPPFFSISIFAFLTCFFISSFFLFFFPSSFFQPLLYYLRVVSPVCALSPFLFFLLDYICIAVFLMFYMLIPYDSVSLLCLVIVTAFLYFPFLYLLIDFFFPMQIFLSFFVSSYSFPFLVYYY